MKLKFLILILFFPSFCFGYSVQLSPAKISADSRPLKAGETISLTPDFFIYSDLPPTTFKITAECLSDQKQVCPDSSYFLFSPSEFISETNIGQKVSTKMIIPRNAKNGDYQIIIIASPLNNSKNESNASLGISVGSKLNFKIAGKVPAWKSSFNFMKDNTSNLLAKIGFDIKTAGIILGLFAIFYGISRMIKALKRKRLTLKK